MDRLGEHVDGHVRLDRQHALVDGGGRVRAGHRRADELTGRSIDHDRDVPERRFDGVAAAALREVGHELECVEAGLLRRLDGHPDERRLGIRVRRPG